MQNHWQKLTGFLRIEGAPLDNNCLEQALKASILNRKNAYFYKTQNGALVGKDVIATAAHFANEKNVTDLRFVFDSAEEPGPKRFFSFSL